MPAAAEVDTSEMLSGLHSFIESAVLPLEAANHDLFHDPRQLYDARGGYTEPVLDLVRNVREASGAAGYYGMFCPADVGCGALGNRAMLETYESIYLAYGPGNLLVEAVIGHWSMGPSFLCSNFTPETRDDVLVKVMGGQVSMCFGMTEPNVGTDAWMMSTRAVRDGDEWVINGTKQWTSNAPYADYCYLFAVTDPEIHRQRKGGVSCFLVPMSAHGVSVDSVR